MDSEKVHGFGLGFINCHNTNCKCWCYIAA